MMECNKGTFINNKFLAPPFLQINREPVIPYVAISWTSYSSHIVIPIFARRAQVFALLHVGFLLFNIFDTINLFIFSFG